MGVMEQSVLTDDITRYRFFAALKALPQVQAIWLFGSRARGKADEWADVDIAIDAPTMTESGWHEVQAICAEADILVSVQPIWLQQLEVGVFAEEIERDKVLLYKREEETHE
jgi:uncharacterized protein